MAVAANAWCLFGPFFFFFGLYDQMMIQFEGSWDFASRISGSSILGRISGNSVCLTVPETARYICQYLHCILFGSYIFEALNFTDCSFECYTAMLRLYYSLNLNILLILH